MGFKDELKKFTPTVMAFQSMSAQEFIDARLAGSPLGPFLIMS